ncbi:MAG: DUF4355 domain-containing protein [Clostridia bacterium]|nr:DUF4355 domain-containing protein [Clostridia bacterium]MBO7150998.1 DUF4355 domain-containing protein [Clostridia bacterium]
MKKSIFDLQIFADEGAAAAAEPVPAEGNDNKAAAEQDKAAKEPKGGKGELKYSDADLDEIINKKFAKWEQKKQKEVDEATKLAEMNAEQRAKYERDQFKKELDEYKRKDTLAEMSKTARKMLADEGISVPDELLSLLVTTDASETKTAVEGFSKAFTDAVESAVKERLKGEPPKKGTGGAPTMTKEAIMAIKDPELRQKKMLENKHLFNF